MCVCERERKREREGRGKERENMLCGVLGNAQSGADLAIDVWHIPALFILAKPEQFVQHIHPSSFVASLHLGKPILDDAFARAPYPLKPDESSSNGGNEHPKKRKRTSHICRKHSADRNGWKEGIQVLDSVLIVVLAVKKPETPAKK